MRSTTKKILFALLILMVIGAVVGYKMWNEPHKNVRSADAISVSANDLYSKFVTDSASAKQLYENQIVIVSGEVKQLSINEKKEQIIFLKTDNTDGAVNCTMEEEPGSELKAGQQIKIKGICSGYITGDPEMGLAGDVYLVRCYLSH